MVFKDRTFILAGSFKNGDKGVLVRQMIEMCGGVVKDSPTVTKDVSYVVLGANGSPTWKDGECPQAREAEKRRESGQDISVLAEETLFEEMAKEGVTVDSWRKAFQKRLNEGREAMRMAIGGIGWSFDASTGTLEITSHSIPNVIGMVEDAEIVSYSGAGSDSRSEDVASAMGLESSSAEASDADEADARLGECDSSDLDNLVPWSQYSSSVKHLYAPNLIEVPPSMFAWMESLETIDLPAARIIGNGAFYECKKLETVTAPRVMFVGNGAFSNCRSIKGRLNMGHLEYIGPFAFCRCKNLASLSTAAPARVRADGKRIQGSGYALKAIGEGAFAYCESLKSVGYDKDATMVGENAFYRTAFGKTLEEKTD